MHNCSQTANVKGDFLNRLGLYWYRIDTNYVRIARFVARSRDYAPGSRLSSAKSDSIGSRARISSARVPSMRTSAGRGRVL